MFGSCWFVESVKDSVERRGLPRKVKKIKDFHMLFTIGVVTRYPSSFCLGSILRNPWYKRSFATMQGEHHNVLSIYFFRSPTQISRNRRSTRSFVVLVYQPVFDGRCLRSFGLDFMTPLAVFWERPNWLDLGRGFKCIYSCLFYPYLWKWSKFDSYFERGWKPMDVCWREGMKWKYMARLFERKMFGPKALRTVLIIAVHF